MSRTTRSKDIDNTIITEIKTKSIPYEYKTKDYPLEVLKDKWGDESDPKVTLYIPKYQRKFVWRRAKQSRYIESVLLGVPITPFLVSEDKSQRLEIIDGSQRIRTLLLFIDNEFKLDKLKKLPSLNGLKFKDLPEKIKTSLLNRDFRIIVVSEEADLEVRQDIFDRINTSGEKLSDSEIRKGSYSGPFFDMIINLSTDSSFRKICPVSDAKERRGEYEELILRFFAFSDSYLSFKHDVAAFLDDYLLTMQSSNYSKEQYENRFRNMVSYVEKYFPNGFRKDQSANSTPRVRFEAISVGAYLALSENGEHIPTNMKWLQSKEFSQTTTSDSSNNPGRLKSRVEFVRDCLLGRKDINGLSYA